MEHLRAPMQKFAMALFQACRKQHSKGNFLYSPMNASTGLFLILMGSDGETREEIEGAMKFYDSPLFTSRTFEEDMKLAFRYIMAIVDHTKEKDSEISKGTLQVSRMNKLFVKDDTVFLPGFKEQAAKLKAELETVNFLGNEDRVRRDINEYVEEKMIGKIQGCFERGAINQGTKMVLVNGLCFTGRWQYPFPVENTNREQFYELDGTSVEIEMMQATVRLPYNEDSDIGLKYVEIPYLDNIASLIILLPKKKCGLKEMEKTLNPVAFNKINLTKRLKDVNIKIPKFSLKAQLDMKSLFMKMGTKSLVENNANLSRMTQDSTSLSLSAAVHNTYIDTNEYGTGMNHPSKAIGLSQSTSHASLSEQNLGTRKFSSDHGKQLPVTIVINHPFLFAVRHNRSAVMLLLGRLETMRKT